MVYTDTAIITQRQALVRRLVDLDESPSKYYPSREHDVAEAVAERLPVRLFGVSEAGQYYDSIWATDIDAALRVAAENFDPDVYAVSETEWVDVQVNDVLSGEAMSMTMQIDPPEPECSAPEHDWQSPYEVVGGLRENPGVWGHGGGVVIRTVCAHCGAYRTEDTWAQRQDTGEQGMESTSYAPADDDSLAWVAEQSQ